MRKNNRPFRQDELIDLGAVFPLRIINDEATKWFTDTVGDYYGTNDYDVQLILMPDIFARYPDEPYKPLVFGSSVGRVEDRSQSWLFRGPQKNQKKLKYFPILSKVH
jgi:hypothetical protein